MKCLLVSWVECSPMIWKTWIQFQVESYQRLSKWYLIPLCLTLSNIRYISRVKWSNQRKGVAPSPTPRYSSYWKGSLLVALDYGCQLTYLWSVYLFKMIANFINILALKTLILQLYIWSAYLFRIIVKFINILVVKSLMLQLNMKWIAENNCELY